VLKEITDLIKTGSRVIISGGLNPDNVNKVTGFNPYAVDVASGVEEMPGKKNEQLVREFIAKTKKLG
jgi:phosphoribosylanthranilate isomerase